ncbi:MAG TPA: YaaL family protein [Bacillota bacterium]|nr:YaaL family protein [Bacillota bacterium]HOR84999.1 YaaL family protein [Bacillota bacterium]HPL52887.1 YaaL family protein [Bacillota bacterium]
MSTNLADREPKKHKQISDAVGCLLNSLQGAKENDENKELLKIIFIAKQEMSDAQSYFDSVTAPELVDHAIYKIEAARSQYIYLLKLAKNKGLRVNI